MTAAKDFLDRITRRRSDGSSAILSNPVVEASKAINIVLSYPTREGRALAREYLDRMIVAKRRAIDEQVRIGKLPSAEASILHRKADEERDIIFRAIDGIHEMHIKHLRKMVEE